MSAAIDFSKHAFLLDPDKLDAAQSLSLPWFESCTFSDDVWHLRETRNKGKLYTLKFKDAVIGVNNETLGQHPDLMQSVKLFLVFAWSSKNKLLGITVSTPESANKHFNSVLQLIQYLKHQFNIVNFSSINKAVVDQIQIDYLTKTLIQRLNAEERAIAGINAVFADSELIKKYTKAAPTSGGMPTFKHTGFLADIGLNQRQAQYCKDYQRVRLSLQQQHRFNVKSNSNEETGKGETKNVQTESAIRKPLQTVKALFRVIHILHDFFPVTQQVSEAWLSDTNVRQLAKKYATSERSKTRDIPRPVFYRLMDEAIRWVLDYSDNLLAFREESLTQFNHFINERTYKVKEQGSDKNRDHYASKQMTEWFKRNQPSVFPYSINSVEKSTGRKINKIDISKVEEAKCLVASGLTHRKAADQLGCNKSSVNRWLNYSPPIEGTSLKRAIDTHLVSACLLVIFAFTGRRKDEIMGLGVGCIEVHNGSYFIHIDQEKRNQGDRPLPTLKLVAKAVELLETLTAKAREEIGTTKLLKLSAGRAGGVQDAWPDFNDFCDYTKIDRVDEEGHNYSFADHQFRRFLAMTYYYRYPDSDLMTLSWFLGHTETAMTMEYITDKDGQFAMDQVRKEFIAEKIDEERKAGNLPLDNGIAELFDKAEAQTEGRVKLLEKKYKLVDKYVVDFVPDGACFGRTPDIKERSKCLLSGAVQTSSATCGSCIGCPNLISVNQPMTAIQLTDVTSLSSPMLKAVTSNGGAYV